MILRRVFFALALAAVVGFALSGVARANEGEDMNVHNETGHTVAVFLFQDDHVHTSGAGGTQFAVLKNHESAVAHVPACHFAVVLVDKDDVWHAEFHDCHSTEMTFTSETGHTKKK
jgi:hypothetical protein